MRTLLIMTFLLFHSSEAVLGNERKQASLKKASSEQQKVFTSSTFDSCFK